MKESGNKQNKSNGLIFRTRTRTIISIMLLFIFCVCFLCACNKNIDDKNNSDNTDTANQTDIVSVRVHTQPNKTNYLVGEIFTITGGKLEITRKNGKIEIISMKDENIIITSPYRLLYWTNNQQIGVKYYDPITLKYTKEIYLSVKVEIDNNKKVSEYISWNNNFLYLFYPKNYEAKPNPGKPAPGGATMYDYTENIVTFSETGISDFFGFSKSISIRQGNSNALDGMLRQSFAELNAYYTQSYQSGYRESYNDNSLQVDVTHHNLTSSELSSLTYLQNVEGIRQEIIIKKRGTFLGLGDWTQRIDFYLIQGGGKSFDIAFTARNSTFDNNIIKNVFNNLHIKYDVVYTD